MAVRSDIFIDFQKSPRVITVLAPSQDLTLQDEIDTLRNLEDDPLNMDDPHLVNAFGKQNLGGGVKVGITAELQNAKIAFQSRNQNVINSSATVADASGGVLIDASSDFVLAGIKPGDIIINFTDKSVSTVINVDSPIQITHEPLADGLANTWAIGDSFKIYPLVQCELAGGNQTAIDGNGADISPILQTFGTQIVRTSSSSATLSDIQENTYNSAGGIHVDFLTGEAGTTFPIGIPSRKSNNLKDAKIIADKFGLKTIFFHSDMVLDRDFPGFIFVGATAFPMLDLNSRNVSLALFKGVQLTGDSVGMITVSDSILAGLTSMDGFFRNCGLVGTNSVGTNLVIFTNCFSRVAGTAFPILDLKASQTTEVSLRAYSGGILIKNSDTPTSNLTVELIAGNVVVDSSNTAGVVVVRGVGTLVNNAAGTTVISSGFINSGVIKDAVLDEPLSAHGVAGSVGSAVDQTNKNAALIPAGI